jgi:putative toxin-antitoxin system antitoxin component (TIGR02293 family)
MTIVDSHASSDEPLATGEIDGRALALLGLKPPKTGADKTRLALLDRVRTEVTYVSLEKLRQRLALSRERFASVIGVSDRTLSRHGSRARRVGPAVAERSFRVARIQALAEYVLEDAQAGQEWLDHPQPGLGGRIPREVLASEFGAREVEDLLNRIEHGVYT